MMCFWDYEKQLSRAKGGNMERSTLQILSDAEMDGKRFILLEGYAPAQRVLVHYWIDPRSHLIIRSVTQDAVTKRVLGESKTTRLELDVKVDGSTFTISELL